MGGDMSKLLGDIAAVCGAAVRSVPGVGGATAIAVGAAWGTHTPAVGLIVGGTFAILFGREL